MRDGWKIIGGTLAQLPKGYYLCSVIKIIAISDMTDEEREELKARIEAAKQDLGFFSLYWDDIKEFDGTTDEELEEGINDCLDDLSDALRKLNENSGPP